MNWKCWWGHDWERIGFPATDRVCLRCRRHEVAVSEGGGWGGWREINDYRRIVEYVRHRQEAAKRITDTSPGVQP